ncbi:hypothetical protein [Methylobacter sp.]|jgi:hypothetical protein|uniref:hypothetical protein n=1 Tax=Methylobacter sp. TaxID=2051955 RepID=UPI003DA5363A
MRLSFFCVALFFLFCNQEVYAKTISRLQYRYSNQDSWAVTESIFHSFGKDHYLLQIYDREHFNKTDDNIERYELYLGTAIKVEGAATPFGLVARAQKWSSFDPIAAGGIELNFNRMNTADKFLKEYETTTFIQFFVKTNPQQLGRAEILHYYQINNLFNTPLYVRGYNIFYIKEHEDGGSLINLFADFIFPLHKHWDVYTRWNYLSKDSQQLGTEGNAASLGIRFNF